MDKSIRTMVMASVLSLACSSDVAGQGESSSSGAPGSTADTTESDTTTGDTTEGNTTTGNTTASDTTMATPTTGATDSESSSSSGSSSSSESSSSSSESTTLAESTGNEPLCMYDAGGPGPEGSACTSNDQCSSGVCVRFSDAPVDPEAACGGANPGDDTACTMRFTGTVLDISTRVPTDGADLRVVGALDALSDPVAAVALASGSTGDGGRLDITSDAPIDSAFAVIALVEAPTAYLTATSIAFPIIASAYGTANDVHDLWLVPSDRLTVWSDALADDPAVPPAWLPLGDAGGVVGLVRDADGLPIAGAVVSPANADSNAIIRYVHDDDAIEAGATGDSGLVIVLGAAQTGEDFAATLDGESIATGRTASTDSVVVTLILTAP